MLLTLLYTPGQLRDATGLPVETYRHWKKTLAPMRKGAGHSPSFTPGDLVAVAVTRLLTENFGIKVGTLTPIAEPLFALCNQSPWPVLERSVLIMDVIAGRLSLKPDHAERPTLVPAIVFPLAGLIATLRETMLATSDRDDQASLRFPPTALPTAAGARS